MNYSDQGVRLFSEQEEYFVEHSFGNRLTPSDKEVKSKFHSFINRIAWINFRNLRIRVYSDRHCLQLIFLSQHRPVQLHCTNFLSPYESIDLGTKNEWLNYFKFVNGSKSAIPIPYTVSILILDIKFHIVDEKFCFFCELKTLLRTTLTSVFKN